MNAEWIVLFFYFISSISHSKYHHTALRALLHMSNTLSDYCERINCQFNKPTHSLPVFSPLYRPSTQYNSPLDLLTTHSLPNTFPLLSSLVPLSFIQHYGRVCAGVQVAIDIAILASARSEA